MSRFVVLYLGRGAVPKTELKKILEFPGVRVLNDNDQKSLMLEVAEPVHRFIQHMRRFDNWTAAPVVSLNLSEA